jgi:hypothetical protein
VEPDHVTTKKPSTPIKKNIKLSSFIYKVIQSGTVATSYMRKGFLIFEQMRKYFSIYEEAIYDVATADTC